MKSPMPIQQFINVHRDRDIVVIGTGPSAWSFGQKPEVQELLRKTINIAVNRGFTLGIPVQYQMSLDQVWKAFIKRPKDNAQHRILLQVFAQWKKEYGLQASMWNFDDWCEAYKDDLHIRPEVWRWLMLMSPHAPFVRFTTLHNSKHAPYSCVGFVPANVTPQRGVYANGMLSAGNSAFPAIHLATVMGARRILLLGIDMAPPNNKERPWEGPAYYRKQHRNTFKRIMQGLGAEGVINLNPTAALQEVPRVQDEEQALLLIRRAGEAA